MKLKILFVLILLPIASLAEGPSLPAGFDENKLNRITTFIDERVSSDREAGIQLTIVKNNQTVLRHNSGLLHGDTPIRDDAVFFVHSMMKPITSLAIMQLLEDGELLLSDAVSRFLPEFQNLNVYVSGEGEDMVTRPATTPMTIGHLLTHTAGFTYAYDPKYAPITGWYDANLPNPASLADVVAKFAESPLAHDPGTAWQYGPGTNILGRIVEVVSDQPLPRYLQTKIFGPLGMKDSGYRVPEDKLPRMASRYYRNEKGKLQESDYDRSLNTRMPVFTAGDSGLFTTSADYLRFCRMILNMGKLDDVRVAAPGTIRLMTTNMVPWDFPKPIMPPGKGFTPGFSIYADHEQTQSMVSAGSVNWGAASGSIFWIDFEQELIVIMMTQSYPPNAPAFQTRLESMVYGAMNE